MWKDSSDTRLDIRSAEQKIAERIRCRRQELGYSYQTLADLTGMSKSTLNRYENGDIANIPLSRLETLSKALQVNPDWLLGWTDNSDSPKCKLKQMIMNGKPSDTVDYAVYTRVLDELFETDELWDLITGYALLTVDERKYLMKTLQLLLSASTDEENEAPQRS